jgi:ERCC4-type nuclease
MIIRVDARERDLFQIMKQLITFIPIFKNLTVISENLPLGDIIISENKNDTKEEIEYQDKIIIERKTISDLLSSIKDGRYEEQSYRLSGINHANHNIIYLIEGDVNKQNHFKDTKIEKLTAYSAMFSLNYFKGFSVFRTFTMDESAIVICNMAYKLEKAGLEKKPFYHNNLIQKDVMNIDQEEKDNNESTDKDYVSVIKKVKKENITQDNIGEIMLCQIPGISSITAIAIMSKFQTFQNFIKEVEANNDLLKEVAYVNTKGQTKKLNKTCISNILKYLFQKAT